MRTSTHPHTLGVPVAAAPVKCSVVSNLSGQIWFGSTEVDAAIFIAVTVYWQGQGEPER